MPFEAIGGVLLGGTRFSTDPIPYEPMNWVKRHSVHPCIGGRVVFQDFGVVMRDNKLRLGSGGSQFLDEVVFLDLYGKFRTRGASYPFSDWLGNSFTVFMLSFVAVPWKQGRDSAGNLVRLYTYNMELQATEILTLLGRAYAGS